MKTTSALLALAISLAGFNAAHAEGKDYSWTVRTIDDPINGRIVTVHTRAYTDGPHEGLVSVSKPLEEFSLSLIDTNKYFCPRDEFTLKVTVWFSDTKRARTLDWTVEEDRKAITARPWETTEIVNRMMEAPNTIFRVMDGCGDVTDYMVGAANGEAELQEAGF